jgi:hypothetical protein
MLGKPGRTERADCAAAITEPARLVLKSYEILQAALITACTLYQFSGFSFKLMDWSAVLSEKYHESHRMPEG